MNAISAVNLSKIYRVYNKPADRLKESLLRRSFHAVVHSLKNVSFNIPAGDTIGIIGENGAGKSTLLKIMAGITSPTSGQLHCQGRIAALLELGSGFHPEFSGRTNIHLNAALLGLTEKEIREREKGIIEFSELNDVIDRPVKTYSSGMYVRLAFSIATSVDPDVLIVDEALSVGDQRFSQKCVDRMVGFQKAGKTIIVCSHSMFLINELCANTLWLNHGQIAEQGKTSRVVSKYLTYLEGYAESETPSELAQPIGGNMPEAMITSIGLYDEYNREVPLLTLHQTLKVQLNIRCIGEHFKGHLGIGLERSDGQIIFASTTKSRGLDPIFFSAEYQAEVIFPSFPILKGSYRIKALIADENALRVVHECYSDPLMIESEHPEFGMLWMAHEWIC